MTMKLRFINIRAAALLVFIAAALQLFADQIMVKSFRQDVMNLAAATSQRLDLNGNPCALVIVNGGSNGLKFSGSVMGEVEYRDYAYWVYMPGGTKQLKISYPTGTSELINFAKYGITRLEPKCTYLLEAQLVSFSVSVEESPIEMGLKHYSNGRYNVALGYFLSEPDSAICQAHIGSIYLFGDGVPKNEAQGMQWIDKAIAQNNTFAMLEKAYYLTNVKGNGSAPTEAIALYSKAAKLGDSYGYYCLGKIYQKGMGVAVDLNKAKSYYEKAVEMGDEFAMNSLGVMYMNGEGVKQDYKKALEVLQKSHFNNNALYNQGIIYYNGFAGPKDLAKAFSLFSRAAKGADSESCLLLSKMYDLGEYVEKDDGMAFEWLNKAVERGAKGYLYNLGVFYYNGKGVEKDRAKAKELWQRAATEYGDPDAIEALKKYKF